MKVRPRRPVRRVVTFPERRVDRDIPGLGHVQVDTSEALDEALPNNRHRVTFDQVQCSVDAVSVLDDRVVMVGVSDLFPDPEGDVVVGGVDAEGAPVERRFRHDLDAVIARELEWLTARKAQQ